MRAVLAPLPFGKTKTMVENDLAFRFRKLICNVFFYIILHNPADASLGGWWSLSLKFDNYCVAFNCVGNPLHLIESLIKYIQEHYVLLKLLNK